MMNLLRSVFLASMVLCFASTVSLCQQAMPNRVLFRISPQAVPPFREAFTPVVSTDKHFDPQRCALQNDQAIRNLLGFPTTVSISELRPFIPQHNVALEDLREKTNPLLFAEVKGLSRIAETPQRIMLRSAEEKISRWFELKTTGIGVQELIALLKKSPFIEVAEPRYSYHVFNRIEPDDPQFKNHGLYGLELIHAPEAWGIRQADSTMIVADDDIGVEWTHEDLKDAIYINPGELGTDSDGLPKNANGIDDDGDGFIDDWHGWDFAGDFGDIPDNNPTATQGHGTHTSGIMAAVGNNKKGVVGVAFGAKLLPLKCSSAGGQELSFGYEGIVYAADKGASVVNNSWGGRSRSEVGQDIVDYATAKNCLVVAASGNDGDLIDLYPASYRHVLSVANVGPDSMLSVGVGNGSNYNINVDIAAPGMFVYSTVPGNSYQNMSGTSMASPHAAGAAAIIRAQFPLLTPDQIIERIRVTGWEIPNNPHPGFTGGGILDMAKALSSTALHSARIIEAQIEDNNHDGLLQPGESGKVKVRICNFLEPLQAVTAQFVVASGPASITTAPVIFGPAATLDTVINLSDLSISVFDSALPNQIVTVKAFISSTPDNYITDVDYFTFVVNPTYLDLKKNNVHTTITSNGSIGFNDPPNSKQGVGFIWQGAPPSIIPEGRSILFTAGLMVGTDVDHIVAVAPSSYSDNVLSRDFKTVTPVHYVLESDHPKAVEELGCVFNDVLGGDSLNSSREVGVTVKMNSYEFAEGASADAVVLDYVLTPRITLNGAERSDNTAAAIFMDWDIGPSGSLNLTGYLPVDSSIAFTRRIEPGYPIIGIKRISELPLGAEPNFYAINNDGSNNSVSTYGGFDPYEKWESLNFRNNSAGPGDVSMVYGIKHIPFASEDSLRMTYIIAFGVDNDGVKAAIDKTEAIWKSNNAVAIRTTSDNLLLYPNPASTSLQLQWPGSTSANVIVTDILGRIISQNTYTTNSASLDINSLEAGSYTITVRTENEVYSKQFIKSE